MTKNENMPAAPSITPNRKKLKANIFQPFIFYDSETFSITSISSLAKLIPRSRSVNVEIASIKIGPKGLGISNIKLETKAIIFAALEVKAKCIVLIRFRDALLDSIIAMNNETKESFLLVIVISQAEMHGSAELHFDAIEISAYLKADNSEILSSK